MTTTAIPANICMALTAMITFACSGRHEISSRDWANPLPAYEKKGQFIRTGQKKFILDSLTSLRYPIIQYSEKENLVISFTSYDCSFVLFDYKSSTQVRKIKVSADPIHGIGKISTSFTCDFNFVNYDSIYLFNSDNGRVVLLDSSGRIHRTYSVTSRNKKDLTPHTNFGELMTIAGDTLYMDASPGMDILKPDYSGKGNLVAALDLGTGRIAYSVKYPGLYSEAFWGEHLYEYYSTYNSSQHCFVRSFPIDHNLYVYGPSGSVTKYYAGSKYVSSVKPYIYSTGNIDLKEIDEQKEVANYIGQRCYHRILYDPHSHLYYRFVTNANPDAATGKPTPFSIIVLDEKFKPVGEQEFDAGLYSMASMFITDQGLHLAINSFNEDELAYDIYKFKPDTGLTSRN